MKILKLAAAAIAALVIAVFLTGAAIAYAAPAWRANADTGATAASPQPLLRAEPRTGVRTVREVRKVRTVRGVRKVGDR